LHLSEAANAGKNVPSKLLRRVLSSATGLNQSNSNLASILWLSTRPQYNSFANPSPVISLRVTLCSKAVQVKCMYADTTYKLSNLDDYMVYW